MTRPSWLGRAAGNGIATPSSRRRVDGVEDVRDDSVRTPVQVDFHTGEADERRRLSGALWGLKTVTTATTLTKFMGTMVLCDTSFTAITGDSCRPRATWPSSPAPRSVQVHQHGQQRLHDRPRRVRHQP